MRAVGFGTLLFFLANRLLGACAGSGEYCHGWSDSNGSWHAGFQCPERYDGQEATLCCGSCGLRYCCSLLDNRLDQGVCSNDNSAHQEPGSHGQSVSVPMYLPFLIVGSIFVAFVIVGSFIAICCCRCLKPKPEENQQDAPTQSRLLEPIPPPTGIRTPSRHSTSSTTTTSTRSSMGRQNNICSMGTDGINLYMNMPTNFPVVGCHQAQQFLPSQSTGNPFLPAQYLSYGIPPDHTLVMAPAYGQQPNNPYSHGPLSADQIIYPAVTL
ncbi:shisa family member 2a [Hypanus sabinus]|uniref:shisa family member 2a n=1 Tax=Hypanus sabinus TaxID=79690 RepID=UPI0028C45F35|nr:shisa family member 2a [Hypanus sabinus]